MDPDQILDRLIETGDVEGRTTLLNELCGDDARLREQVIAALAARDISVRVSQYPSRPDPSFTASGGTTGELRPGTTFDRYRVLDCLGEGGMGIVYLAQQEQPVRRRVAIKITKAGMNRPELIARFQAERQALALMDHENIAKVLDAGATEDGRLYLVMELVKGVPITEYCDMKRLPTRERLEIFMSVCHAIQHAHQKGILHRDVKPSNVLVADQNGRPVAKVIDFGLAKALELQLTPHTLHTQFGQVLGTLEYMSPEQANFGTLDVDTRSDVYSLGVLLYELMTGTTPLGRQRLRSVPFDQVLQMIREEEPSRPSLRLTESSAQLADVAARHGTEVQRLRERFRGDLDAIVMKALEKDRNRRYDSAAGLAADIVRHLRDEPVEARPPSAIYLIRKFTRRHRALVVGLTAVLIAIALGIGFSTFFAIRAQHAATQAAAQAQLAQEQRDLAMQTLRDVVFQIQVPLLEIPAARGVRQQMLEEAISGLKRVAESFGNDRNSSRVMMVALEDLGDVFLTMGPDADAGLDMDHREFAQRQYERAKQIAEQLLAEAPDDPGAQYDMYVALGRLSRVRASMGHHQQAAAIGAEAVKIIAQLAEHDPERYLGSYFISAFTLSGGYFLVSDLEKAIHWTETGMQIAEQAAARQLQLAEPIAEELVDELKRRRVVFGLLPSVYEDEQIALQQPADIKHRLLIDRAKYFLDRGDHVQAASTLQTLLRTSDMSARDYYGAACRYARCADVILGDGSVGDLDDESSGLYESHCKKAVKLVREAHQAGYFDSIWMGLALLHSDPDLDPIRERADFRAFIAELQQAAKE